MDSRMKKIGTIIGIISAIVIVALIALFIPATTGDNRTHTPGSTGSESGGKLAQASKDSFSDEMVDQLRRYYGRTISEKGTQASIITVRDFILGVHPQNGKAYFYAILKRAFPGYADEIMDTLAKLDQYNRWLEENASALSRMTEDQRTAALWSKRRELFGKDAEKVWSGEMLATDARKAKVQETLAILNQSRDTSLGEKVSLYESVLRQTYGNTPEEYILDQKFLLSKVFFSIDSVQDELKKLSPEERQAEINDIRRQMGLPEQQVEEMARRDADNEKRWQTGFKYMEERDQAVRESQGQELEEKLDALREQYFKDEAQTIALEEKDSFFRFKRPRVYGRN